MASDMRLGSLPLREQATAPCEVAAGREDEQRRADALPLLVIVLLLLLSPLLYDLLRRLWSR